LPLPPCPAPPLPYLALFVTAALPCPSDRHVALWQNPKMNSTSPALRPTYLPNVRPILPVN
jgi:hypothetical protein